MAAAAVEVFPEELMTLILSKLPVKSVLRFKCVQKSWYSLINSPYFINLHHSSNQCFMVRSCKNFRPHVLSFYSYETLDDLGTQITLPLTGRASLSGSCDGLVCITNFSDKQILICNPMIPGFRSLVLPPPLGDRSFYCIDSAAFGSDPNTGQYKVLMVGAPHDYDDNNNYENYDKLHDDREGLWYDFSTDTWCKTAAVFPQGPFFYERRAISLQGTFHWCPWYKSNNILTFHISNEVTGFMPLPDFVGNREKQVFVSSKDQLSLLLDVSMEGREGKFEIYVMTEYGVNESWTRILKVRGLPSEIKLIPFWDERRLLLRNAAGQMVSCNQHKILRRFPIHPTDCWCDVCPFSQSLVSVNIFNV